MRYQSNSVEEYMAQLPEYKKEVISKLKDILKRSMPEGFVEVVQYDMIGYVVPHSIYAKGYHVNPTEPLPFLAIASQKDHIAIYHLGIYMFPEILKWFQQQYPKYVKTKLDIGKSCLRLKNIKTIPYELIEDLIYFCHVK